MLMNFYEVATKDGRYAQVFALRHEIEDGDLVLYHTSAGMYTDTFPEGCWTRFAVNGEEQTIPEEIKE